MAVSPALRQRVRQQAANRCGYCLSLQQYLPYPLEIEHVLPSSRGGSDNEDNLWLACRSCNMYKSNHISQPDPLTGILTTLFHPRQQRWDKHFQWSSDLLRIEGKTAIGRTTILTLQLNNFFAITARHNWVQAGWHPPN